LVRVVITGKISFIFLPWNLFLAFIPYYISARLQQKPIPKEKRVKSIVVFIAWLLFIPNSFYILTDLFHLQIKEEPLRWFDLTLIFSFAWNGLLLGILSVRQMEKIMWARFRVRNEFFFLYPLMWLIALGIYIGRYMRFNSWDVITNPFQLVEDISYMMIHPFMHFYEWGMITCFSVFMTIIYMSVKRMAKAL
jgi:uncharacterized membrane protein